MSKKETSPEQRQFEKNTLYLHLSGISGTEVLSQEVDVRNITLKNSRVKYNTLPTNTTLLVSIPGLGPNQMNNNISGHPSVIPIIQDVTKLDSNVEYNITWTMNKKIPTKLKWRLLGENGLDFIESSLDFVDLLFEYDYNPL